MWILMYVFAYSVNPAATSDKAEWRLRPTVVFQEFSNEERCRSAKAAPSRSLGPGAPTEPAAANVGSERRE